MKGHFPLSWLVAVALGMLAFHGVAGEPTTVTIQPQAMRQEFQGMGCGANFYEAHITSLGGAGRTNKQERLYDDMFARCRTDFLQLMIRHDHEPVNDNADPFNPQFDEKYFKYCEHALRISEAAKKRNPAMQLYAVLYTPPAWMKTNNDPSGGGKAKGALKPGLELELGEFAWAFLAYMHRHGQTIQFLSICNEPDWPHTQPGYFLTPDQHADLLAKVGAYLDEMAKRFPEVPRVKLVAPNVLSAVDCAEKYLPATLARTERFVDVVGCHDYDWRGHRWAKLRELAGKRPLWMTEGCVNRADSSPGLIRAASEFWLLMTEAFNEGVNVWMAYDWVYPPHPGGEALIHLNWSKDYALMKTYHAFRQWCAPLVPGMRVVATQVTGPCASDIATPGVKASAFVSADGRRIVIQIAAVQDKPAEIVVKIDAGFDHATAQCWRTSSEEDAVRLPDVVFREGRLAIALPARSMLTLTVTNPR
jgi:O-glycosyl hydrolase